MKQLLRAERGCFFICVWATAMLRVGWHAYGLRICYFVLCLLSSLPPCSPSFIYFFLLDPLFLSSRCVDPRVVSDLSLESGLRARKKKRGVKIPLSPAEARESPVAASTCAVVAVPFGAIRRNSMISQNLFVTNLPGRVCLKFVKVYPPEKDSHHPFAAPLRHSLNATSKERES